MTPRIYCWRGGLRSSSIAWLAELLDLNPILLDGGYKSYRRWVHEQFNLNWPLKILGGRTGTGKTDLLLALQNRGVAVIDLEGIANHRGSSFGSLGLPAQPSTEYFENQLAESLDHWRNKGAEEIWIEAESIQIGNCRIPNEFFKQMKNSHVLEIKRNLDQRISQLVTVYGRYGQENLADAIKRISRRLGPQRTKEALEAISTKNWSDACKATLDYYDKCYDRELAKSPDRISVDLDGLEAIHSAEKLIRLKLAKICV